MTTTAPTAPTAPIPQLTGHTTDGPYTPIASKRELLDALNRLPGGGELTLRLGATCPILWPDPNARV